MAVCVTNRAAALGPFSRRVQLASIVGCAVIGGGTGYLYADSMALARIEDLSAQSRLRKEYQQLWVACVYCHGWCFSVL